MKKIVKNKVVRPLSAIMIAGAVAMFGSTLFCTGKMINDTVKYDSIESQFNQSGILKKSIYEEKTKYYNQYKSGEITASEYDKRCKHLETDEYRDAVYSEYDSEKYDKLKQADNDRKASGLGVAVSLLSSSIFGYAGVSEIKRNTEEQNQNKDDDRERY